MKLDRRWWLDSSSRHNGRPLQITQWDLTIKSDAPKTGWGASCQGVNSRGPLTAQEKIHINYLELLAVFLTVKSFTSNGKEISILPCLDNVTAITFLNRYPFTPTLQISSRGLELVPRKEHDHTCRASPRSRERTSRLGILTQDGLLQLEAQPGDIPAVGKPTGPLLNQHGCFQNECPTSAVLLLETGPSSLDSRRSFNLMEEPLPIHVPSICPHTTLHGQVQRGENYSNLDSPSVAQSDLIPSVGQELIDLQILLPSTQDIVTNLEDQNHPMAMEGHIPLAAWPVSGNPAMQKDFRQLLASSGSHCKCRLSPHIPIPRDSGIAGVLSGALIHFQPL